MKSSLRDFVEEHKREGEHHSRGDFTLDPTAALDKIARFGLDSPEKGLLRLIQLAVAARPRSIEVVLGKQTVQLCVSQPKPNLLKLEGLDRALRLDSDNLSVALLACLHSGYRGGWISDQHTAWQLFPDGLRATQPRVKDGRQTVLFLEREAPEGFWARLRTLLRRRCLDHKMFCERLGASPISVTVDGVRPSSPGDGGKRLLELFLTGPKRMKSLGIRMGGMPTSRRTWMGHQLRRHDRNWETFEVQVFGARPNLFGESGGRCWKSEWNNYSALLGHFWIPLKSQSKPRILFVSQGVVVGEQTWEFPLPLHGVVSAAGLDLDLSGLELVDNKKLERLKEETLDTLESKLKKLGRSHDVPGKLQALLRKAGFARDKKKPPEKSDKRKKRKRSGRRKEEFTHSDHQRDRNRFRTERRQLKNRR